MKQLPNLQGIAIPFFTEQEWIRARDVMEDANTFFDPYHEFVARVEKAERDLRGKGQATIRVHLRMDEFVAWCTTQGCKVNSEARAKFAAMKAAEIDRGR